MKFYMYLTAIIVLIVGVSSYFLENRKSPDSNSENISYLSVESGGQLGNQMFHYATGLAYAKDHNLEARFPRLNLPENNMAYNRDHIFFRLNPSESPVSLTPYILQRPNYEKLPDNLQNVNLIGGISSIIV